MKTIITLFIISIALVGVSQNTSGVITYEETINFQIDMEKLEEQGMAEFVGMMPTSTSSKKQLYFTKASTLYLNLKKDKKDDHSEEGGMVVMFSNPDNKTYIDNKTNKVIEQQDFMGKMFLIDDTLETLKWKITGETKVVMNYPCIKATMGDSLEMVEAWFTTEIPISIGPEKFGQLPGVILELTSKKTRQTIKAIDFKFREVTTEEMQKPTDGKNVTKKKYDEIVESKMKEMNKEYGNKSGDGSGNVIMITR